MEGKPTLERTESKPATEKLVKVETSNNNSASGSGGGGAAADVGVDATAKIAEAFQLDTNNNGAVSDDQVYRDPAPLKWRIFEVVAKTNGQRAFGTYWSALRDFMHGWLSRDELEEALNASLGAANVHLHNELILCLLHNAHCRYLPVELLSQVPASSRGKVVHVPRPPQAPPTASSPSVSSTPVPSPPSTATAALSGTNAAATASSSASLFQGKRTGGLLSNAGEKAATANGGGGRGSAVTGSGAASGAALKIEIGDDDVKEPGVAGVAAAAVKPEAKAAVGATITPPPPTAVAARGASFSPGGKRRRDDDRIPPSTAMAATTRDQERRRASALGDAVLEEEIMSHFGPSSDLWRPWSGRGAAAAAAAGRPGRQQSASSSNSGRNRSASSDDGPGLPDHGDRQGEVERRTKALKSELGAAAGGPVADGGSGYSVAGQQQGSQQSQLQAFSERAAGRAAAEQVPPGQRSQRVPGARTLAPFLQALTASQQMKVSHEVCRVMTAGVKEYLRRIIEACLASAREEGGSGARQLGVKELAGVVSSAVGTKGTPPAGSPSHPSNGTPAATTVAASGIHKQPPPAAAAPSPISVAVSSANGGGNSSTPRAAAPAAPPGGGRGGVLTPGHLQTALETTPRLVGPPSSARAQWRRVATYAGDHPTGRGFARVGPAL
eukprot:g10205.t1